VPSAANPGRPYGESIRNVAYTAGKHETAAKKQLGSVPIPEKGMKFVSNYIRNNDDCLTSVKHRSEGPFAIIDSVLEHYGLPLQLKYLAVIESELKTSAVSRVGAKGPWQLMPSTAHVLGLKVNRRSDERTNYYMSTRAAAKYLRDLHREFGDWLLVLAAYNGGPRPVSRAIHKSHSRDFWTLQRYLPAESRQHVKKFIATAYYFENVGNPAPTATTSQPQPAVKPTGHPESATEKFNRLMLESEVSLKSSKELLAESN
jgi:membrane-bound lytic murein transglycosylase D